jgi:hypothetical protein
MLAAAESRRTTSLAVSGRYLSSKMILSSSPGSVRGVPRPPSSAVSLISGVQLTVRSAHSARYAFLDCITPNHIQHGSRGAHPLSLATKSSDGTHDLSQRRIKGVGEDSVYRGCGRTAGGKARRAGRVHTRGREVRRARRHAGTACPARPARPAGHARRARCGFDTRRPAPAGRGRRSGRGRLHLSRPAEDVLPSAPLVRVPSVSSNSPHHQDDHCRFAEASSAPQRAHGSLT